MRSIFSSGFVAFVAFVSSSLLAFVPVASGQAPAAEGGGLALGMRRPRLPQDAEAGRELFRLRCSPCHGTGTDRVVGPGLKNVTRRRGRDWLLKFISDPTPMIGGGDSIAAQLFATYEVPMPKLGLSRREVEDVVAFLGTLEGGEGGAEAGAAGTPGAGARGAPPPVGDPTRGRALFTGARRLAAGAPACLSCHTVDGLGRAGGGTLGRNLTEASAKFGPALTDLLRTTPFPVMRDVFDSKPLRDDEIADLAAFLAAESRRAPSTATVPLFKFPAFGLGGTLVLLLAGALLWRGRLKGVRKPLAGSRR